MADGGMAGGCRQGPFRHGDAIACPDCGAGNWHVGRRSAECGGCGAALPLAGGAMIGAAAGRLRKGLKSFRPGRLG